MPQRSAVPAIALTLAACLLVSSAAGAQSIPPLDRGARVRMESMAIKRRETGIVIGTAGDTLVLATNGGRDTLAVSAGAIDRLELSQGTSSRSGAGMVYGGLIGLGAGVVGLGVLLSGNDCSGCAVLLAVPVGTMIVGGGIGAVVGAFIRGERWEPVPLVGRRSAVMPGARPAIGLSVSVPLGALGR